MQRARGTVSLDFIPDLLEEGVFPVIRMKNCLKLDVRVFGSLPLSLVICGNIGSAEEIDPPGWHQQNMWLTWANATGVDSFGLSLAMPGDPFCICLIGIPISNFTLFFAKWVGARGKPYVGGNRSGVENHWCITTGGGKKLDICKRLGVRPNRGGFQAGMRTQSLNESRLGPQELGLLGLVPGNYCLFFNYFLNPKSTKMTIVLVPHPKNNSVILNPSSPQYKNVTKYCHNWTYPGSADENATVRRLPPGVLLISGDRAWPALLSNPIGGPCYLGKLTMFDPRMCEMLDLTVWRAGHSKRTRRAMTSLGPDCDNHVEFGVLQHK